MARNRIEGITISIGSDTTEFNKGLSQINKATQATSKELRTINNALKFNPRDTNLLTQAQTVLGEQIQNTSTRLDALKQAQAQVEAQFASGEIDGGKYRAFQRDLIITASQLENLQTQAKDIDVRLRIETNAFAKFKSELQELGPEAKRVAGEISSALSNVGAGISLGGIGLVESTQELSRALATAELNAERAGLSAEQSDEAFNTLLARTGDGNTALEAFNNILASGIDNSRLEETSDILEGIRLQLGESVSTEGLAESLKLSSQNSGIEGQLADLFKPEEIEVYNSELEKLNTTQERTAYIVDLLAKGPYADLTAEFETNNQALVESEQAQAELTTALANLGIALTPIITSIKDVVIQITEFATKNPELAQTVLAIGLAITGLSATFSILSPIISTIISVAKLVGLAIGAISAPVAIAGLAITALIGIGVLLYKNWDVVKEKASELFSSVKNTFNNIKDSIGASITTLKDNISNTFNSIREGISSRVTAIRDNVSNGFNAVRDGITSRVNSARDSVTNTFGTIRSNIANSVETVRANVASKFEAVRNSISNTINSARDTVRSGIDAIKGFFTNLKLPEIKFPKIKLPRFSIKGEFSLSPPRIPTIGVDFFAKGGVMTKPTAFGMNGNNLMVGGEVPGTSEAILPLTANVLGGIGKGIAQTMQQQNSVTVIEASPIYLDGRQIGEATFNTVNTRLSNTTTLNNRLRGN